MAGTAARRAGALYGILDQHLEGRNFVAGDVLTMGDIPLAATLYRYFTLEIERPALANVEAYYRRISERAAYAEHVKISYEDMRVTEG